jgi:hypothetical protein
MTPAQISWRDALIARSDAALERWPDRSGPEFAAEMAAVARGFEELAHAADRAGDHRDALERSQIWRYAGNAWFDLGAGRDREKLEYAAAAYRSAEEALAEVHDAVELIKLNYCYGNTLQAVRRQDLKLARRREHAWPPPSNSPACTCRPALQRWKVLGNAEQIVSLCARRTTGATH